MSRDEAYLHHILEAIAKIERYTAVGRDEFMASSHWQDATIRQLEIVGEAVKHLSPEAVDLRPDVPWRRVAGMRDVLVHNYMGVDLDAVWEASQDHLRILRAAVEEIVNKTGPAERGTE